MSVISNSWPAVMLGWARPVASESWATPGSPGRAGRAIQQPDDPEAFRVMKNKALVLALETCLLSSVKDWKQAAAMGRQWLEAARLNELSSGEGLAIQYLTGRAVGNRQDAQSRRSGAGVGLGGQPDAAGRGGAIARAYQQSVRRLLLDPLLAAAES